eukprot:14240369-Alexandrium_andersonii.AAC.1
MCPPHAACERYSAQCAWTRLMGMHTEHHHLELKLHGICAQQINIYGWHCPRVNARQMAVCGPEKAMCVDK